MASPPETTLLPSQITVTITRETHKNALAIQKKRYELLLEKQRKKFTKEMEIEKERWRKELQREVHARLKGVEVVKERHSKALERQQKKSDKFLAKEKAKHQATKDKYNTRKRMATELSANAAANDDDSVESSSSPVGKRPRVRQHVFAASKQNQSDLKWKQRFEELEAFKAQHGHCTVPVRDTKNKSLGVWVSTQRTMHRKMRQGQESYLNPERIQLLSGLGFKFVVAPTPVLPWNERLEQLFHFHREHGHCNVPQKYETKTGLGAFVLELRRKYRQGKLSDEKIQAVESLDFQWSLRKRGGSLEERMQKTQTVAANQEHLG
jgi:hypothetical protein